MKKKLIISLFVTILSICFVFISANRVFWVSNVSEETNVDKYKVIRVIDGDTFIIDMNGEETRVRMIGIDTPESVHYDKTKNCDFGKTASNYTKNLLEGKIAKLEYDVNYTDQYNRVLAYVYIDGDMINETLVENGYAVAKEYPPNTKYSEQLENAQKQAELHKVGMWSDTVTNQETGGMKERNTLKTVA